MQEVTADSAGVITAGARALHWPLTEVETTAQVRHALEEDAAFHDVSTLATVQSDRRAHATLVARRSGVIAGVPLAIAAFRQLDASVAIRVAADDGVAVAAGEPVLMLTGHARGLLSAERTALNYVQHLSGIATLTHAFVSRLHGLPTRVLDTRKTRPGWRLLEKYAVRAGGGVNHRVDLRSAVLIKDNHLAAVDGRIEVAVSRARVLATDGALVQVECDTLDQVDAALAAGADAVLLDNMSVELLTTAVDRIAGRAITEASGGVTLDTVRLIASSGVDRVSIGALTHSAPALDLALDFHP
jgi:nicotinate-nucleotide pyrophosphorylase (carboxylating)